VEGRIGAWWRQDAVHRPRERDKVWLERVCDRRGTPISAVGMEGHDNGLWRVRSGRHATQFVVSYAEALRVADTLVVESGVGRRRISSLNRHPFGDSVTGTSQRRNVIAIKTERRRTHASGAPHDDRTPAPPIGRRDESIRQSHDESGRTESSRDER
jgi:hypothetical protein